MLVPRVDVVNVSGEFVVCFCMGTLPRRFTRRACSSVCMSTMMCIVDQISLHTGFTKAKH